MPAAPRAASAGTDSRANRRGGERCVTCFTYYPVMPLSVSEHRGVRIVEGPLDAPLMRVPQDATLLLEACFSASSRAVLLHPENVTPRFFDLSSGEAGEVLDKVRRYHVRVALVCLPGKVRFSTRFAEILADDFQSFSSREDACRWLASHEPQ